MKYQYKMVSVYVRENQNLILVPKGLCFGRPGFGGSGGSDVDIGPVNELLYPYTDNDIEQALLDTMDKCFGESPTPEEMKLPGSLADFMGVKSWKKATEKLKLFNFRWYKDDGYSLSPYKKEKRGDYSGTFESEIHLGHTLEEGKLAKAVREVLKIIE